MHEKEISYVKLLCWAIGILFSLLITIGSYWANWVTKGQIADSKKLDTVSTIIDQWQKYGVPTREQKITTVDNSSGI